MPLFDTKQKSSKIDVNDKKIMYYLGEDFLISRRKLASMLRMSPQKLQYRINRLCSEIIHPIMILDYPKLNIESHLIFVKGSVSSTIIESLFDHPSLYFLYETIGSYGCVLNLVGESPSFFCEKYFPDNLTDIFKITAYSPDNFNPFDLDVEPISMPSQKGGSIKLDSKDYAILYALSKDSSLNKSQIAKVSGLDRKTVDKRMKSLVAVGIIAKFRYAFNTHPFNFVPYIVKINVAAGQKNHVKRIIQMSNYSGFTYESCNMFLHQHNVPSHQKLNLLISSLKKPGVEVEVLQKTNIYSVHCIPETVVRKFESLSE